MAEGINLQGDLESENNRIFRLHYGSYEDPKSFAPYHLLLLTLDFIFNWVMDWAHTDPLAILVIFVFQCLGLIVNLIVYMMASASQAMQNGLKKSLVYHHELNLLTCVTYIVLTCTWYIWALRKSWPSVSDQFSFSFSSYPPGGEETSPPNDIITTVTTTLAPLIIASGNKARFLNARRLLQDPAMIAGTLAPGVNKTREFYTLWSSGFVTLYAIQRTVAIIHYFVSLKATFLVLNASTIDKLEEDLRTNQNQRIKRSLENLAKIPAPSPEHTTELDLDEGGIGWRNFGNNSQILWSKKLAEASSSFANQVTNLSQSTTGQSQGGGHMDKRLNVTRDDKDSDSDLESAAGDVGSRRVYLQKT